MTRRNRELPDIDLDAEAVYLADGTRLTNELAAEIVEDVRRQTGRPALAADEGRSPQITFRAPRSLHEAAERRAAREGKSLSQVARDALASYLQDLA